jgi:hypothetical protein
MDENVNNDKGYIHDDVPSRPFVWFTVIFTIFCVVAVVAVTYFYKGLTTYHERNQGDVPTKIATGPVEPPQPQLQADPVKDMVVMDTEQTALLASYGWVDEEKGVARIPIDKAIELTLEHSLVKAQAQAEAAPPAMP